MATKSIGRFKKNGKWKIRSVPEPESEGLLKEVGDILMLFDHSK